MSNNLPAFREAHIDATGPAHHWAVLDRHRADLRELCQRHGVSIDVVQRIEVAGGQLRFVIYLRNAEGERYLDCGHQSRMEHTDCRPATKVVEVPLIGSLPVWWQP